MVALPADVLLQGNPEHQGEVPAAGGPNGLHHLPENPGPVLQAAAVFVGTMVGHRAEKAVEEVVVGGVDLHPIHPALLDPSGRLAKLLDNFLDVLPGGRLGRPPLLPPAVAGGDQGEMGIQLGVGVGAGVEQLGKYLGAIGMHPFRQCPERGNFILPGRVQLPGEQDPPRLIHADHLGDDEPHAPLGPGLVVCQHVLRHGPVRLGQGGGRRRHHNAVGDGQRADGSRGK